MGGKAHTCVGSLALCHHLLQQSAIGYIVPGKPQELRFQTAFNIFPVGRIIWVKTMIEGQRLDSKGRKQTGTQTTVQGLAREALRVQQESRSASALPCGSDNS